ncbi:MAG: PKD domain-containing protein, partial [Chitinophagaceae bacterium]
SNITLGTPSCNGGSYDPLFQQGYPVSTWGKNFGFIPFSDYPNGSTYRVLASEDNTSVLVNGTLVATLNAGQIYPSIFTANPVMTTTPASITADKPICVAQYVPTLACGGGNFGDPDMVILNPIEQNISDITIFSSTQQQITRQWINVMIKTIARTSFTINGVAPATAWQNVVAIPGYSYLRHLLPGSGSYRLKADSGFNAIAYGFSSNFESYAYSAGTNVKDLYQQIGVSTQYGIEPTPSVCKGSPFRFKVSLPYQADSIYWNLSMLPGAPANVMVKYNDPPNPIVPADSITVVNGINIYWYSLPNLYTFSTAGSFPVTITTYSPNTDGCGGEQYIDFDLNVYDPPIADFNFTGGGCVAEPLQFQDNTTTPRPSYLWFWDFGDPASGASNTSGAQNPTHTFSSPGTYDVNFYNITTPGCISNTKQKQITVAPIPSASITGNTTVCINTSPEPQIIFTASDGKAPYTFTYNINGGPNQTISTTGTNTSVTINVPTNVAGSFQYNLTEVKNSGSTLCVRNISNASATVTVNLNTGLTLTTGTN